MGDGCTVIVDVGKTIAKVSLCGPEGEVIARRVRANGSGGGLYRALDVRGIDAWLFGSLRDFARHHTVTHIVPVGHGAAAALLDRDRLFVVPMDYEEEVPAEDRSAYQALRDPFSVTGSPALPRCLNLGMQLHRMESLLGPLPEHVVIVPWPQYWAWRLSGVAATEVSSLGCHTDLWRPIAGDFSALAVRRGWAARFAPLRRADEPLGTITPGVAAATGLPPECLVLCGLHDSNAALLAARGHAQIAQNEATVLSTGTWFVALRAGVNKQTLDVLSLDPARDCLVNVDVFGSAVPSARFMGGREAQIIGGVEAYASTEHCSPDALIARLPRLLTDEAYATPSFVAGVGPFPKARGSWRDRPSDPMDVRAAVDLYLAFMSDAALELIGSRARLVIEGRFAEASVFTRALATLRSQEKVFVSPTHQDVTYGALRLIYPHLPPTSELTAVAPLDIDLRACAAQWRARAQAMQSAA